MILSLIRLDCSLKPEIIESNLLQRKYKETSLAPSVNITILYPGPKNISNVQDTNTDINAYLHMFPYMDLRGGGHLSWFFSLTLIHLLIHFHLSVSESIDE